ncbi:MAG TPA: hypothetical protein VKK79_12555 [Candidatus Lokiarchaeia archaeon]|nr:hypothetical protein [Candidatus Lokiarchaeia archaeon]
MTYWAAYVNRYKISQLVGISLSFEKFMGIIREIEGSKGIAYMEAISPEMRENIILIYLQQNFSRDQRQIPVVPYV